MTDQETTVSEPQENEIPDSAAATQTTFEAAAPPETSAENTKKQIFPFRSKKNTFSRDEWILSNISSDELMEYLKMEHQRTELLLNSREERGKRFLTAFELTVSLASIIAITYLLKDNPSILISILYTIGIVAVFWLWKKTHDGDSKK